MDITVTISDDKVVALAANVCLPQEAPGGQVLPDDMDDEARLTAWLARVVSDQLYQIGLEGYVAG